MTASERIRAAVELLAPRPGETLFEVGCGTGNTIELILALQPSVSIVAIDRSATAVTRARELNEDAIAAGRCRIELGDIDRQPSPVLADRAFSIRVNTFWTSPGLASPQIAASLKPGGEFFAMWDEHADKVIAPTTAGLERAGFTAIRTLRSEGAFAVVARWQP